MYQNYMLLAFRETLKLVKTNGIPKEKAADILASLVSNPPEFMTKAAYDTALERTFQTPLTNRNDVVADLTNVVQKIKTTKVLNPLTIITSHMVSIFENTNKHCWIINRKNAFCMQIEF